MKFLVQRYLMIGCFVFRKCISSTIWPRWQIQNLRKSRATTFWRKTQSCRSKKFLIGFHLSRKAMAVNLDGGDSLPTKKTKEALPSSKWPTSRRSSSRMRHVTWSRRDCCSRRRWQSKAFQWSRMQARLLTSSRCTQQPWTIRIWCQSPRLICSSTSSNRLTSWLRIIMMMKD